MRRFGTVAVTAVITLGVSGLAAGPALASSGHGRHQPSMNISFRGGGDDTSGLEGSAHWIKRRSAVLMKVAAESTDDPGGETTGATGTEAAADPGTPFAEIVIHHVPRNASPGQPPVLTVSGDGSPYLEIDFGGGAFLRGVPGTDGSWTWTPFDSTRTPGTPGPDFSGALAAEGASPIVTSVSVYDVAATPGGTFTDTVTALQYNGVALVPGTNRGHMHSGQATEPSQ